MCRLVTRLPLCLLLLTLDSVFLCSQEPPPIPLPGQGVESDSGSDNWLRDLEFGGYVENTLNAEYQKVKDEGVAFNNLRSRLNVSGKVNPHLDFGVTLIGILNAGTTEFSLVHYLPEEIRRNIVPGAEALFLYEMENDLYFQEAFATFYGGPFKLRAGRHKFYSGTGYAFNPIDLFNRKDPLDPTYEVDGQDAVLVAVELPKQTELEAAIRFGNDFETIDYQAKVRTYIRGWDFGGQYTHHVRRLFDWEAMNNGNFMNDLQEGSGSAPVTRDFTWRLIAAEFAGEIGRLAFHGEGGYVFIEARGDMGTLDHVTENHERFLLGTDYTFENQLYLIAEYVRIGQGRAETSDITLNDRMAYLTGETLSVDRDTIFAGASYPLTHLTDIECYGIIGANDPSLVLNPWFSWSIIPAMKFSASAAIPIGGRLGQNGDFGPGGFLRLRYSF